MMNPYTSLARASLEQYFSTKTLLPVPNDLPEDFYRKAGVFVSWHTKDTDTLRGCIGTVEGAYDNIADEIIHNAIASATEDHRFPSITPKELTTLKCKVDVLSPFEPVSVPDEELDPRKFGIYIVSEQRKSGLLLPDLDGVNTIDEQLSITLQKAGIDPSAERVTVYRFTVTRYSD